MILSIYLLIAIIVFMNISKMAKSGNKLADIENTTGFVIISIFWVFSIPSAILIAEVDRLLRHINKGKYNERN